MIVLKKIIINLILKKNHCFQISNSGRKSNIDFTKNLFSKNEKPYDKRMVYVFNKNGSTTIIRTIYVDLIIFFDEY